MTTVNPYESPIDSTFVESGNDAIRMRYLRHERAVQSISVLYYAAGIFMILIIVFLAWEIGDETVTRLGLCSIFALFAAGYVVLGRGIQKLRPWARIVSIILTLPGLLGFPLGTAVSLFIFYLLLSAKGKFVFSEEYAQVRAATPHLDKTQRTSPLVFVFLGFVIMLAIIVLLGAVFLYFAAQNPV